MSTPLLLISGAGLPDWIWDDLRGAVRLASVVAPRPESGTGVADYARAALEAAPAGEFILVAHSSGGVIATDLAGRVEPGRIVGVLAVAAVIPGRNRSFTSSLPFPHRIVLPVVMRLAGPRPPDSAIRRGLAADLDEPTAQRLLADFAPEPRNFFTTRAGGLSALQSIPRRTYLRTTQDAEMPDPWQRRFARLLMPSGTAEIASGHLPMMTHPRDLAAAIGTLNEGHGITPPR